MTSETAIDLIARQDWLERTARAVQPVVVNTFEAGGQARPEDQGLSTWIVVWTSVTPGDH
jgi:hypothetical protein